ncbi:MAG: GNAT family N-acetyltransferase [Fastidiosipila sp.]|nr:GNAT family N-acetyltransferase [Fastidiosipila sp.]
MHENTDVDAVQQDKRIKMLKNVFLQGDRVIIRNIKKDDYGALTSLFSDKNVMYYYLPGKLQTFAGSELEDLMDDWNDMNTAFLFTVLCEKNVVGLISCESIDFDMGHLECGIALINSAARGRGLATEAMTVFIDYLFKNLGLHRINARIISGNETSARLFRRLGFKLEGRQREYVRRDSLYLDMNLFGLLAHEWQPLNST